LILLKLVRANSSDNHANLISLVQGLVQKVIQQNDKDNMLIALECIGLMCLLNQAVFKNYTGIFLSALTTPTHEDGSNLIEKVISLKSAIDSIVVHCGKDS
jgi:hypothetical protein